MCHKKIFTSLKVTDSIRGYTSLFFCGKFLTQVHSTVHYQVLKPVTTIVEPFTTHPLSLNIKIYFSIHYIFLNIFLTLLTQIWQVF